jgi:membrane AbrB-like protein
MLLGVTLPISAVLELAHLPAALLLGPMVAGIILAGAGHTVQLPERPFLIAQGLIGCLMARSIPLGVLGELAHDWPLFLSAVIAVIAAAATLGWLLTRWQVLGGTTAIWGAFPGAAMTMTLMAEAFGADIRLVAFMQYLRVVLVAALASLIARLAAGGSAAHVASLPWFSALHWQPLLATVALAVAGALLAARLRVPAGSLLLPMFVGLLLKGLGLLTIELPPWLLAVSYALLGWSIGLKFTRSILGHVARALPKVAASILTLVAVCGLFAVILVKVAGIDPLTAYLATSPGGADSVAIIAASSQVDVPFVMAMQTARFIVVLLSGPALARWLAARAQASARPS